MSRNGSGTYTLPSGNPVVSGTLIEASWANTTLSDLASAMTDSLSRSGQGGMTAALRLFDGTSSVPGLAWGSETTTGWYRAGAGDMRLVVTGSEIMRYQSTGVGITGTLSASGNTTVGGTLGVTGATTLTGALTINGGIANNPTITAGTANGVAYLNGSKVLTTGSALTFDGTNLTTTGYAAGNGLRSLSGNAVRFYNAANANWSQISAPAGTGDMQFDTGAGEQMRLTSTGLGIGTSSPQAKLHVQVSALSGYPGVANAGALIERGNGPAALNIASPNTENGIIWFADQDSASVGNIRYEHSSNILSFRTNGSDRFYLDSSGNLGLGVTPSAWQSYTALQMNAGSLISFSTNDYRMVQNSLRTGGSWRYVNNGPAGMYLQDGVSGGHAWLTAPSGTAGNAISFTQAMTLTAAGDLLVGQTGLLFGPSNTKSLELNGSAGSVLVLNAAGSLGTYMFQDSSNLKIINTQNGFVSFGTNNTERARIDSSGNFMVSTTTNRAKITAETSSAAGNFASNNTAGAGTRYHAVFYESGTERGSITSNGSATSYNTSSDYRLKNITGPVTNSGAYIDSLKPVEGTWLSDGSVFVGLLAHEAQAVSRTQVSVGDKDGERMQAMDYSSSEFIANMIAELQSLRARVATLESN